LSGKIAISAQHGKAAPLKTKANQGSQGASCANKKHFNNFYNHHLNTKRLTPKPAKGLPCKRLHAKPMNTLHQDDAR
jgi:hypothetical protein